MKTLVIGAGLAGLVAAIRLREGGHDVTLVTKGIGGIQLGQGTIDVLGYAPDRVSAPLEHVAAVAQRHPDHPYALLHKDVEPSLDYVVRLLDGLLVGDPATNLNLPSAVGAIRPTALAQPSMIAGECVPDKQMLIVGFNQLKDFWPELIAGNLSRTPLPGGGKVIARHAWLDLPAREGEVDSSPLTYARAMDDPDFRARFVQALRPLVKPGETVGLPGVLGLNDHQAWSDICDRLGQPVFEISTIPPSVPGMRINSALTRIAKEKRVKIVLGSAAIGLNEDAGLVTSVTVSTTGRPTDYKADAVVFAPGGFESGALAVDSYMSVLEPAFNLPVWVPEGQLVLADHAAEQPLFRAGVRTDEALRPVDSSNTVVYDNLYAAGGVLAGASRWREKSGDAIAIASAWKAANTILGSN